MSAIAFLIKSNLRCQFHPHSSYHSFNGNCTTFTKDLDILEGNLTRYFFQRGMGAVHKTCGNSGGVGGLFLCSKNGNSGEERGCA